MLDLVLDLGGKAQVWRSTADDDPSRVVRGLLVNLEPGQGTDIRVTATDASANIIVGVSVTLVLEPAGVGGTLAATSGTIPLNGTFFTTLTATVGTDTTFRITATASGGIFTSSSASTSVLARMRGGAPPTVGAVPGLDTVTMVIVVAAAAVLFTRWQARRRPR